MHYLQRHYCYLGSYNIPKNRLKTIINVLLPVEIIELDLVVDILVVVGRIDCVEDAIADMTYK